MASNGTTSSTPQLNQGDPSVEIVTHKKPSFKKNQHSASIYTALSHAAKQNFKINNLSILLLHFSACNVQLACFYSVQWISCSCYLTSFAFRFLSTFSSFERFEATLTSVFLH